MAPKSSKSQTSARKHLKANGKANGKDLNVSKAMGHYEPTPREGGPANIDVRKLRDEFIKPIDDTHTLISDFLIKREIPMAFMVAQAEAMRDHMNKLIGSVSALESKIDGFNQLLTPPAKLIAEATAEKKRLHDEVIKIRDRFVARRDQILVRSSEEMVSALEAYEKGFEDLAQAESDAVAEIESLCVPFSIASLDAREEPRPRQPVDIGDPYQARSLIALAGRAEGASKPGGPLERLMNAAAKQGGNACTAEMGPVKGFRRALQKAEEDYGGDFLMINDFSRCSIIASNLSGLAAILRWLTTEAAEAAAANDKLPLFEPLLCKDRQTHGVNTEGDEMYRCALTCPPPRYVRSPLLRGPRCRWPGHPACSPSALVPVPRYVLVVGRLACDSGELLNVEIQLHVKRLYAERKKLNLLFESRASLGANDDAVCKHEGELSEVALGKAAKGLVTKLACAGGSQSISADVLTQLQALLHSPSCMLKELSLSATSGLEEVELGPGLLLPAEGETLACVRLVHIRLAKMGLVGGIPEALAQCTWLQVLELQDNQLTGPLPVCLANCEHLATLALHGNLLTGAVPGAELATLLSLSTLTLGGEVGGNPNLYVTQTNAAAIAEALPDAEIYLPRVVADNYVPPPARTNEVPLPAGWAALQTAEGKTYYYHKESKKTQWKQPTADMAAEAAAGGEGTGGGESAQNGATGEANDTTDSPAASPSAATAALPAALPTAAPTSSPPASAPAVAAGPAADPLPAGWAALQTAEGKTYYYHKESKKTQWKPPTAEAA